MDESTEIRVTEAELHKLLKEAVLAHERHLDLNGIKSTLEHVTEIVTSSVGAIATKVVTRLLIGMGVGAVWFSGFLLNMRDSTRDLQRSMDENTTKISEVTRELKEITYNVSRNSKDIRDIVIKSGLEHEFENHGGSIRNNP